MEKRLTTQRISEPFGKEPECYFKRKWEPWKGSILAGDGWSLGESE
jgi:hypothetical protein